MNNHQETKIILSGILEKYRDLEKNEEYYLNVLKDITENCFPKENNSETYFGDDDYSESSRIGNKILKFLLNYKRDIQHQSFKELTTFNNFIESEENQKKKSFDGKSENKDRKRKAMYLKKDKEPIRGFLNRQKFCTGIENDSKFKEHLKMIVIIFA